MVHLRSSPDYTSDTIMWCLFHDRSPQRLLTDAASWRFAACPCRPTAEGLPLSSVEHDTLDFYMRHLPCLRDTRFCTLRGTPTIERRHTKPKIVVMSRPTDSVNDIGRDGGSPLNARGSEDRACRIGQIDQSDLIFGQRDDLGDLGIG